MQTISAKKAADDFSHLIEQARHEPVTISCAEKGDTVILSSEMYSRMLSEVIWYNFCNIEKTFPVEDLIQKHQKAGVPMYYSDSETPEGKAKCLLPDGTIQLVKSGKEVEWPVRG